MPADLTAEGFSAGRSVQNLSHFCLCYGGSVWLQFFVRDLTPGDIVIMDNLVSHKSEAVHELIERTLVPAALLARPEPDRAGLCQTQPSPAQSRKTICRCTMERNWTVAQLFPAR